MWGYVVVLLIGFLLGKNKDGLSEALNDPEKFMEAFKAAYKNKMKETTAWLLVAKKRGPDSLKQAWAKIKADVQAEYDKQAAAGKKPAEKKAKK
ncbi:hypothetical protein A2482_01045 [Candidatus Falkowbacteria bacterium RIFOXYC2_FULL_48_21]|uniref:Uncharacterized protein n=1 Tax=Candidatus Falkowbacteria bacterium RIFOXYC2_FULL_48_21 TaxID=1798005 RepID=A0A1F5TCC0_9BACT|nr:MAG: hypothetical protein A2482_01045 [Candidatus Falkowbacteria bacterium RIFOXYC2_FULL_48_21]